MRTLCENYFLYPWITAWGVWLRSLQPFVFCGDLGKSAIYNIGNIWFICLVPMIIIIIITILLINHTVIITITTDILDYHNEPYLGMQWIPSWPLLPESFSKSRISRKPKFIQEQHQWSDILKAGLCNINSITTTTKPVREPPKELTAIQRCMLR